MACIVAVWLACTAIGAIAVIAGSLHLLIFTTFVNLGPHILKLQLRTFDNPLQFAAFQREKELRCIYGARVTCRRAGVMVSSPTAAEALLEKASGDEALRCAAACVGARCATYASAASASRAAVELQQPPIRPSCQRAIREACKRRATHSL